MSHMAPGEGSPNDNEAAVPEQPYEAEQGTGDAERPQEQVQELQEKPFIAPSDAAPRTDTDGKAIPPQPEKPARSRGKRAGKHTGKK